LHSLTRVGVLRCGRNKRLTKTLMWSAAAAVGILFVGSPSATAGGPRAYYACDIFNGQVNGCGSWYQGKAVVYK